MKVLALAAITVDGKISKSKNALVDWTSREDKKFFMETTKAAGVIVLGRTTFETFPSPLPGRLHIVMTHDTSHFTNQDGVVEYTSQSPKAVLENLTSRGFETVVIAGGASIYTQFLKENLIDELWLTIEPVIFGEGIDLLAEGVDKNLQLIDSATLAADVIVQKYQVLKD